MRTERKRRPQKSEIYASLAVARQLCLFLAHSLTDSQAQRSRGRGRGGLQLRPLAKMLRGVGCNILEFAATELLTLKEENLAPKSRIESETNGPQNLLGSPKPQT